MTNVSKPSLSSNLTSCKRRLSSNVTSCKRSLSSNVTSYKRCGNNDSTNERLSKQKAMDVLVYELKIHCTNLTAIFFCIFGFNFYKRYLNKLEDYMQNFTFGFFLKVLNPKYVFSKILISRLFLCLEYCLNNYLAIKKSF